MKALVAVFALVGFSGAAHADWQKVCKVGTGAPSSMAISDEEDICRTRGNSAAQNYQVGCQEGGLILLTPAKPPTQAITAESSNLSLQSPGRFGDEYTACARMA
jgi:hypothetical protein